jgi:hypothetical protein
MGHILGPGRTWAQANGAGFSRTSHTHRLIKLNPRLPGRQQRLSGPRRLPGRTPARPLLRLQLVPHKPSTVHEHVRDAWEKGKLASPDTSV